MSEKQKYVGQGIVKKDAKALLSGKPVYTDDLAPENALCVKLKRSIHAFAKIKDIDISKALEVEGIKTIINAEKSKTIRNKNIISEVINHV